MGAFMMYNNENMKETAPGFESPNLRSPEEEIAYLRTQLAEKERAILEGNKEQPLDKAPQEAVREYTQAPQEVLHETYRAPQEQTKALLESLTPEKHDTKVSELLTQMQEKGVKNILDAVSATNDPHLLDDVERALVQYIKEGFPVQGMKEESPEFKALNMTLFEVTLPEKNEEGETRPLAELISSMEQFYSGMLSVVDPKGTGYFTIELAVADSSSDFSFNVAVHDSKKSLFEKQILSVFPDAKIEERKDDYNVFSETGVTVASYAKLDKNAIWPLKTYEKFDYDPLNSILNSFSKIKREGEGAALQFVITPQGDKHTSRFRKTLEDVQKGEKISEAIARHDEGVGKYVAGFFKGVASFTESAEARKEAEEKKKEAAGSLDDAVVQQFRDKIDSPTAAISIRIVASAGDEATARNILTDIESSFNQFENTGGNKVTFVEAKKSVLEKLIYNFSFRLSDTKHRVLLNLKELTSLMHFPASSIKSSPHLKTAKAGTAPAPLGLASEGVLLGVNTDRGVDTPVYMTPEDRLRHFYVIGQTGTGKTTLLKNMIVQDIQNGEGVCMIDPHGSDVEDVLAAIPEERYEDVIYFDPAYTERPMGLNMLEYDPRYPEQKTFVVNELLSIFDRLFDMKTAGGPLFEQYFRNSVLLVMEDPSSGNTLLDVSRVLSNKAYRDMKLSRCQNPVVVQFWREVAEQAGGESALANIVPYVTSKFDVFLSNDIMRPIITQQQSSFDFRDIMDNKKILLVNLSKGRLGDINANLIGLIVVGKILMAALSRVDSLGQDLAPFYLYIDEFQNITTDSISTILSEARKYKLSLNIAHQFIAQLEEGIRDSVFGNVGSMAAFRVGSEDAEMLESQFSPVFNAKDIMSIDNRNAYLRMLVNGQPVKPFNIHTMAPQAGNKEAVQYIKELSHALHGRDRATVEAEIAERYT